MEVYGVRLEAEARRDVGFAADLAAMLPPSSRVMRAMRPQDAPLGADVVLCALEHDVRCLAWGMGGGKGPRPKPLFADGQRDVTPTAEEMDAVAAALGIER